MSNIVGSLLVSLLCLYAFTGRAFGQSSVSGFASSSSGSNGGVASSPINTDGSYFSPYPTCRYPAYDASIANSISARKSGACPQINTFVACPMIYTPCRTGCISDYQCPGTQKCCQINPCGTSYSCQGASG